MNMSYCQFENTCADLDQVIETLENNNGVEQTIETRSSQQEKEAVQALIEKCRDIIERFDTEHELCPIGHDLF